MSDKDDKRLMQCLLIACAFVLVLLYLYFTKGACWEMKEEFEDVMKALIIISFIFICITAYLCIFHSGKDNCTCGNIKTNAVVSCISGKTYFCLTNTNIPIPPGIETIIVRDVDTLGKLTIPATVKDIYVTKPCVKVAAQKLASFPANVNVHLCKDGTVFTIQ